MVRLPIRSIKEDSQYPPTKRSESMSSTATLETNMTPTSTNTSISTPVQPDSATLSLHPLKSKDGMIVKIQPPHVPLDRKIARVPCDIVLVIDVSGSMGFNAPLPDNSGQQRENFGLSVLDLVKHAARTILSTMNKQDRLGIVTFASAAKIVQGLTPMTSKNKEIAKRNIESMQPFDATNLWAGLQKGIELFNDQSERFNKNSVSRVPAIFVLTDGMPNHMCPAQGYIPKIRSMKKPLPASIHTFGFGYSLRSGLLKSLAEIGSGNYAFIPDAGMIGTVFVHAVANLQAAFATTATLTLWYRAPIVLEETTGISVDQQAPVELEDEETTRMTINLGNLQYGQSRDIYLRISSVPADIEKLSALRNAPIIHATLTYARFQELKYEVVATTDMFQTTTLPKSEIAYHKSRSAICSFLSDLFPLRTDGEHQANMEVYYEKRSELAHLIKTIPARAFPDEQNQSLMRDLEAPEPEGQIALALSKDEFFNKWGVHYLPSVLNAHQRQICNSFKDPGPLQYGKDSPLFIACRDKLDNAFDALPAPKPSNHTTFRGKIDMQLYNSSSSSCFAASTPVKLASGQTVPIRQLRKGVVVQTPLGARKVVAVLKTPVRRQIMCRLGNLLVTPWHPISMDGKTYVFPAILAEKPVLYSGAIFSVLLQRDADAAAHAFNVAGLWGVTLGHGLTVGRDVRAHRFFGRYDSVVKALAALGMKEDGMVVSRGVVRKNGLVCGFRKVRR